MDKTLAIKVNDAILRGIKSACHKCNVRGIESVQADTVDIAWIRYLETFKAEAGNPAGYAYRVAYNATLDSLKHERYNVAGTKVDDDGNEYGEVWDTVAPSPFPRPDQALQAKQEAARLVSMAESLGVTADLTAMVDESADLDSGKVRVHKHRIQAKLTKAMAK